MVKVTTYDASGKKKTEWIEVRVQRYYACKTCDKRYTSEKKSKKCCKSKSPIIATPADPFKPRSW